uniref:Beta-carotene 15, 15-dioxygenase 2, like n=1 Tax=Salarias fasciatus TaxID=181472 RepID=A0A672JJW5_SALFA
FKDIFNRHTWQNLVSTVEETPDPIPTTIKGTIPSWINGSFLRNGPGKFEFGEDRYTHWFDGMAMMHRFHICEGGLDPVCGCQLSHGPPTL